MNTNINLLLHDEESLRRRKKVRIFNFVAIIFLLITGLFSLVTFIAIQAIDPPSVKKDQGDVLQKVSQLQDKQAKLFVLNNRVENIDKILKTRKNPSIVLSSILEKIPSKLTVDNLELDGKRLVLTGQSNSLSAIGEFINNLTDMVRKKDKIKSLTLSSLAFDQGKNVYQISISSEL